MTHQTESHNRAETVLNVVYSNAREFRDDFYSWMQENVHVYEEFERRALAVARFRDHYSARTIAEVMRHDTAIRELGEEYKLNGNYVPHMARLFAMLNSAHAGLFSFRDGAAYGRAA